MANRLLWRSVDELIEVLQHQRDALSREIEELKAVGDTSTPEGRATAVLCEYLFTGSAADAADWANDLGWQTVTPKLGDVCSYQKTHVYALIDHPPPGVPRRLVALCRRLRRRG